MSIQGFNKRGLMLIATLSLATGFGFLIIDIQDTHLPATVNDANLARITGSDQSLRSLKGNEVCSGNSLAGQQQPSYCTGPVGTPCITCEPAENDTPLGSAIAGGPEDPKPNLQNSGVTKPCNTFQKRLGTCQRNSDNKYYCTTGNPTGEVCANNYSVYGPQPQ